MKIGIITIHKSEVNYGACLQCYALWKYISNLGHDCEVIDLLRPSQSGYHYKLNSIKGIKAFLILGVKLPISKALAILRDKQFRRRINRYRDFNNIINYSATYSSPSEIDKTPPIYDIYISGSDQIWNPNMSFDNKPYLLSFVPYEKKKIAYASSLGVKSIPDNKRLLYSNLLNQYKYISTRENSGQEIVQKLTNKDIPVVLDPVFLLSIEDWEKVIDKTYKISYDYILVYSLHENKSLMSQATQLAKQLNYKVILVNANYNVNANNNICQLRDVGPSQWLNLIKESRLFLTDSFHGTAFSIILNTPFLTWVDSSSKTSDRIYSLLSSLKLEDRIFDQSSPIEKISIESKKNETKVLLEKRRQESITFLAKAIYD